MTGRHFFRFFFRTRSTCICLVIVYSSLQAAMMSMSSRVSMPFFVSGKGDTIRWPKACIGWAHIGQSKPQIWREAKCLEQINQVLSYFDMLPRASGVVSMPTWSRRKHSRNLEGQLRVRNFCSVAIATCVTESLLEQMVDWTSTTFGFLHQ